MFDQLKEKEISHCITAFDHVENNINNDIDLNYLTWSPVSLIWCTSGILIFEHLVFKFEVKEIKVDICQKISAKTICCCHFSTFYFLAAFLLTYDNFCKYFKVWLQNLKSQFQSFSRQGKILFICCLLFLI